MHVIHARNVGEAYVLGVDYLRTRGIPEASRNGNVLVAATPVTTCYHYPAERVLLDARRDANPFFHLMEALWMLAGAQDGRFLDRYVSDFTRRYAEPVELSTHEKIPGYYLHGAYGHRWRSHFDMEGGAEASMPDQLLTAGQMLFQDPTTRRAVLGMWDPVADLGADKRDLPCNTHVYFRTRYDHLDKIWELDTTVLCRSNDIVWGAYGANAVHMSVMAEVMAGLAGMRMGRYYQVSNNFHLYETILPKIGNPSEGERFRYDCGNTPLPILLARGAEGGPFWRVNLEHAAKVMLSECVNFVYDVGQDSIRGVYDTPWLNRVAVPMALSHQAWRSKDSGRALLEAQRIAAPDWRAACTQWLERRIQREVASEQAK